MAQDESTVTMVCPECNERVSRLVGNMPTNLSLRDYFAGMALDGLMAHSCEHSYTASIAEGKDIAKRCYEISDAMLKARQASS